MILFVAPIINKDGVHWRGAYHKQSRLTG